jgi:4-hydroxybenzoate polyprenyltransferase
MELFKHVIKTSRPLFWTTHLLSIFIGAAAVDISPLNNIMFYLAILILVFPLALFVYSVNDYYDSYSDSINARKNGVLGLKNKADRILLIYCFISWAVILTSLIILSPHTISYFLIYSFLLYFYSAKPLRLKGIPVIDTLVGGGFYFASTGIIASMMISGKGFDIMNIPTSYLYLIIVGIIIHLLGAIIDESYDKKEGTITTAVFLGSKITALISIILGFIGISIIKNNIFFVIGLLGPMIIALICIITNFKENTRMKVLISIFGIIAVFIMGLFLLIINPEWLR